MGFWQRRSRGRKVTGIHDLPYECLQDIFSRAQNPISSIPLRSPNLRPDYNGARYGVEHPLQCAFVCKRWRAAADPAVRYLTFDITALNTETLFRNLGRFHNLTSVSLSGFNNTVGFATAKELFMSLAAATPRLTELNLEPAPYRLDLAGALAAALPAWPCLQSLTLTRMFERFEGSQAEYADVLDLLQRTHSLQNVVIRGYGDLSHGNPSQASLQALGQIASVRELGLHFVTCNYGLDVVCQELLRATSVRKLELMLTEPPPPAMAALTALQKLELEQVMVEHLPDTLGALRNLTFLEVHTADLLDMPDSIGQLSALRELHLEMCVCLDTLPNSLGDLQALTSLRFSSCAMTSLPNTLGNLRALKHLYLKECDDLPELPASVGELQRLTRLEVSHCNLLLRLPETICQLSELVELVVQKCELKDLPSDIGRLGKLRVLEASRCSLRDLPGSVCGLSSLERLNLSACEDLRRLPLGIGQLQGLRELELSGCRRLEVLPDGIGGLRSLATLVISRCAALRLPPSAAQLTGLEVLEMEKVAPQPLRHLPEGFASFGYLRELCIDADSIEQCLAMGVAQLTALEALMICGSASEQQAQAEPEAGGGMLHALGEGLGKLWGMLGPSPYSGLVALQRLQHLTLKNSCDRLPKDLVMIPSLARLTWHTTARSLENWKILKALEEKGCKVGVVLK